MNNPQEMVNLLRQHIKEIIEEPSERTGIFAVTRKGLIRVR